MPHRDLRQRRDHHDVCESPNPHDVCVNPQTPMMCVNPQTTMDYDGGVISVLHLLHIPFKM